MGPRLTEAEIDEIAERAAEKAVAKMTDLVYQEVGKTVVKRALWLIGVLVVAVAAWLKGSGKL